jgi:hypothetical protein
MRLSRRDDRLIVYFVFRLPAQRGARHRAAEPDEHAAIPFQRARPDIEELAEKLRPAALVLPTGAEEDA